MDKQIRCRATAISNLRHEGILIDDVSESNCEKVTRKFFGSVYSVPASIVLLIGFIIYHFYNKYSRLKDRKTVFSDNNEEESEFIRDKSNPGALNKCYSKCSISLAI